MPAGSMIIIAPIKIRKCGRGINQPASPFAVVADTTRPLLPFTIVSALMTITLPVRRDVSDRGRTMIADVS
jgi:hypothetical protein